MGLQKNNKSQYNSEFDSSFNWCYDSNIFQSVNNYFALLGGTAGVMIASGLPTICYYKVMGLRTWNQKLMVIFMTMVVIFGMYGAILSVAAPT